MKRTIALAICAALTAQLAGCGTLMHPERKGQTGGNVDAGIAILDALGLLFFIIPGVVAFAVDFSNGTIYLPPGSKHASAGFDPGHASAAQIEAVVSNETGQEIKLDRAHVIELRSRNEMVAWFARTTPGELALR